MQVCRVSSQIIHCIALLKIDSHTHVTMAAQSHAVATCEKSAHVVPEARHLLCKLVAIGLLQILVDIDQQVAESILQLALLLCGLCAEQARSESDKRLLIAQHNREDGPRDAPVVIGLTENEDVE